MTLSPLRIRIAAKEEGRWEENKIGECRREQNRRRFFIDGRMT
jgi:hypothetical protein